ncbi:MAG: ATPase [Candidatus Micrarchaeia archaeon]
MVEIGIGIGLVAIAAAVAMAAGAFATAMVQSAIGSAGVGAISEKPEVSGNVLLYLVIPETIVIFSFVIAILTLLWLGQGALAAE